MPPLLMSTRTLLAGTNKMSITCGYRHRAGHAYADGYSYSNSNAYGYCNSYSYGYSYANSHAYSNSNAYGHIYSNSYATPRPTPTPRSAAHAEAAPHADVPGRELSALADRGSCWQSWPRPAIRVVGGYQDRNLATARGANFQISILSPSWSEYFSTSLLFWIREARQRSDSGLQIRDSQVACRFITSNFTTSTLYEIFYRFSQRLRFCFSRSHRLPPLRDKQPKRS